MREWIANEVDGCVFSDKRLADRLESLIGQFSANIGQTIPHTCQDWAGAKAAYRFFDNTRVDEAKILSGHLEATKARCDAYSGFILIPQDTTEFSYTRTDEESIGATRKTYSGDRKRPTTHTVRGFLMHGSLALTSEGLPLGLTAVKFWTRKKFKGTNALRKKINFTRIPIEQKESIRWIENMERSTALLGTPERLVHIGDRESDIYELFCAAHDAGTHFLVRTCVNRLAEDGTTTVSEVMSETEVKGLHEVAFVDKKGKLAKAKLELKFHRIKVLPPQGKQKSYPPMTLTVLRATERNKPEDRNPIDWKLITDLPVNSKQDAIEKLEWYSHRWKIETYHKILKSGCKTEGLGLESTERLVNATAVFCIVAWRIFWLTMIKRISPNALASLAFTKEEMQILEHRIPTRGKVTEEKTISMYVFKLARLGGYLGRSSDGPPGIKVIWRGFRKLMDIEIGYNIGRTCG